MRSLCINLYSYCINLFIFYHRFSVIKIQYIVSKWHIRKGCNGMSIKLYHYQYCNKYKKNRSRVSWLIHKLSTSEYPVDKMWISYPQDIHRDIHRLSTAPTPHPRPTYNLNLFLTYNRVVYPIYYKENVYVRYILHNVK